VIHLSPVHYITCLFNVTINIRKCLSEYKSKNWFNWFTNVLSLPLNVEPANTIVPEILGLC
jgi:hypothetical protein